MGGRTSTDTSARSPILLSLGSNVEPARNLPAAIRALGERLELVRGSRVFRTDPAGVRHSPPFLNAALLVETDLEPMALKLEVLRPLERSLERVRTADRNAPRTIDLDLSIYGSLVLEEAGLVLPDPEILTRGHVAVPLADVAPRLRHPVVGRTLAEIASRWSEDRGLREIHRDALTATESALASRMS